MSTMCLVTYCYLKYTTIIDAQTTIFKQRKVCCDGQVDRENRSSAAASEHLRKLGLLLMQIKCHLQATSNQVDSKLGGPKQFPVRTLTRPRNAYVPNESKASYLRAIVEMDGPITRRSVNSTCLLDMEKPDQVA